LEKSGVEKQIPPLPCGMTNKRARAKAKTTATAMTKADCSAALRNDKQKSGQQHVKRMRVVRI
jgi:hypothetical protein